MPFGWLKLKWQSLQNPPVKVDKKRHITKASSLIIDCMVLHNLCLMNPDGGETDDTENNWNQCALHPPLQIEQNVAVVEIDGGPENLD
ncbi:hypothetical protein BGZ54_003669, partial [Gamsiella multidivaricata]